MKKILNSRALAALTLAGTSLVTGCASIVSGSNQVISVESLHQGKQVTGATCQLNNGKGTFYVTTPGTVTVSRAYDNMNVKCEKEGLPTGMTTVKSNTKGMAFGNILFGGFIGAAVDAGTGAAYDYPTLITVMMGEITNLLLPAASAAPAVVSTVTPAAPL